MTEINVIRGDSKTFTIRFKKADGTYMDLSGGKMFFTAKSTINDSDDNALISKVVTCSGSTCALELTHGDTNIEPSRNYICDFQYVSSDTSIVQTGIAKLIIEPDVTNRITDE